MLCTVVEENQTRDIETTKRYKERVRVQVDYGSSLGSQHLHFVVDRMM